MIMVVLAVVLPSLGCLAAGLAAGRAWGRAGLDAIADDAYAAGRAEMRAVERLRDELPEMAEDDGPLVPLPDRLPDADTLTRMYAQLGEEGTDAMPEDPLRHEGSGHEGRGRPEPEAVRRLAGQAVHPGLPVPGVQRAAGGLAHDPQQAAEVTNWDTAAPAERVPTIAELAGDAEYRLCWAELGAARDSAYEWYDREFGTGAFRAVS